MKIFRHTITLFTVTIVSIGLMTGILALLSIAVQAAPTNELDVCPTCTYTTIQTAVNVANPGDTIRVAQGTYQDTITATGLLTTTVLITKDLTLIGGYSPDFQTHDPTTYETIIDGQNIAKGIYVFGASAHIEGFTIINGLNQGILVRVDFDSNPGGASIINNHIHDNPGTGIVFYQAEGNVFSNTVAHNIWEGIAFLEATGTIINNTVTHNALAGIWVGSSTATITGNEIISNTAEGGAGITLDASTQFTVTYNVINGNQAQLYSGGGIAVFGGATGVIAYNEIAANESADHGGGIGTYQNGQLTIHHNDFLLNTALYGGGGIHINAEGDNAPLAIENNTFYTNTAEYGAGVHVINTNGEVSIANNDIRFNHTTGPDYSAGGIYVDNIGGLVTVSNNVVANNDNRGVKGVNYTEIDLINNTIVGNGASAIEMHGWPITSSIPMTATLINNIIANHPDCAFFGFYGAVFAVHNNDVVGHDLDDCGANIVAQSNNINADPLFEDEINGDYHLTFASPAIDSGTTTNAPLTDIEDNIRPQGSGIDMGAYEAIRYQLFLPLATKPHQISNIALGKTVQITTNGANDPTVGSGLSPADVTDGSLAYEPVSSMLEDGVVGFVNNDYAQEMAVTITIDLGGMYDITSIHYNMGNILFGNYWNADIMTSPFQTSGTTPGGSYLGVWTEHTGNMTASTVTIVFKKTRGTFYEDWLFIGEIEVYGIPSS